MNLNIKIKCFFILVFLFLFQLSLVTPLQAQKSALNKYFTSKKYVVPSDVLSSFRHNCSAPAQPDQAKSSKLFEGNKSAVINNIHTQRPVLISGDADEIYLMIQESPPQGVCADIKKGYARASLKSDTLRTLTPYTYEEMDVTYMAQGKNSGDLLAVTRVPQRLLNALIEFNSSENPSSRYDVTAPFAGTFPYDILPIEAAYFLPNGNYAVAVKNRSTEYWELFFFASSEESIKIYEENGTPLRPKNPNPDLWEDIPEGNTIEALIKHNEIYPFEILKGDEYDQFLRAGKYKEFTSLLKRITLQDYPTTPGLRSKSLESVALGLDDLVEEYNENKTLQSETQDETETLALKLEEDALKRQIFWAGVNNMNSGMHFAKDSKGNIYVHSSLSPVTVVYNQNGGLETYIYDIHDKQLSCLLAGNSGDTCDQKKEFNDLKRKLAKMTADHKSVVNAETLKGFEEKWELYDGLAVDKSGYTARTRRTAGGRVLELFSPGGDLMLKDIPISDLHLLANTGDLSDSFYFVNILDDEPDNYSNQPSYEILELKLRVDYSMQR